jgi:hypothetical protein
VVAALVAGGAAFGVWYGIDGALGRGVLGQIVSLGVGLAVAMGAYVALCLVLHVRELDTIRSLSGRFRRT